MPDYNLGKIYSIRSISRPELIYVGSTTQTLSRRMSIHKSNNNTCSSKKIILIGDAYIELIENFSCRDVYELKARENHHMRLNICVNIHSAINDCPHNKRQDRCIECKSKSICEHSRIKIFCKICLGSQICNHQKIKRECKICSPIECDFCNCILSKDTIYRHLKSQKHKKNYADEFFKNFGIEF
jgi:hypothetical protein